MQFHDCNGRSSRTFNPKKYAVMQWHKQAGNITTNIKVELDFTLPEISATNVVTWKCHVDDSAKVLVQPKTSTFLHALSF